ncbi:putative ribonuclease H-like domain-containing protein [Tanacetum coccineum]
MCMTGTIHSEDDENYAFKASNTQDQTTLNVYLSCSIDVRDYANLKRLYDAQREQLSDASVEIKAYTQGLKKVEAQLVAHQQGIKREYSNARTPQQNGVAERKNRTLIEAARTMLADSIFTNTYWAEARAAKSRSTNIFSTISTTAKASVLRFKKFLDPIDFALLWEKGTQSKRKQRLMRFWPPVAMLEAIRIFLAFGLVYGPYSLSMDYRKVPFLYARLMKSICVSNHQGFLESKYLRNDYKVFNALYGAHNKLPKHVQVYWMISSLGLSKKSWCDEFEALMKIISDEFNR